MSNVVFITKKYVANDWATTPTKSPNPNGYLYLNSTSTIPTYPQSIDTIDFAAPIVEASVAVGVQSYMVSLNEDNTLVGDAITTIGWGLGEMSNGKRIDINASTGTVKIKPFLCLFRITPEKYINYRSALLTLSITAQYV
jgi:hypothetical protein